MATCLSRVLTEKRRRAWKNRLSRGSKWFVLAILAAAIGVPVTAVLSGGGGSVGPSGVSSLPQVDDSEPAPRDPFEGGTRTGYGPARPTFRCAQPSACEGPRYVTFNSYYNNPIYGDERPFLAVKDVDEPTDTPVKDDLRLRDTPTTLLMRVYIDNNTYRGLPGKETTDALDTRLRLALPEGPVYEAHPTAYLRAANAKPKVIWDTVYLYASRPMIMTYVPGSAEISRQKDDGDLITEPAPEGIETSEGMKLGRFKADFVNSAMVTFRVRVSFLPEPVRDPRATWQSHVVRSVTLPPASTGPLREPEVDSRVGARFSCDSDACVGAPYVTLNAYRNHPLLGDESDFVRGELTSTYGDTGEHRYSSVVFVRPGDRLYVRIAIDNGADPRAIGAPAVQQLVARNVRVRVMLPKDPANSQDLVAFLESPNALPPEIVDALTIRSEEPVRIRYLPGSASIATSRTSKSVGKRLFALSDQASTDEVEGWGASLPDIPPSFSRVTYVGFTVVAWPR